MITWRTCWFCSLLFQALATDEVFCRKACSDAWTAIDQVLFSCDPALLERLWPKIEGGLS